jgi:hypothetical protein
MFAREDDRDQSSSPLHYERLDLSDLRKRTGHYEHGFGKAPL